MSMLAKVVKRDAVKFQPFTVPTVGDLDSRNFTAVQLFPDAESLEPVEVRVEPQSLEGSDVTPETLLANAREEAARIIEQAEKDKEMIEQAAREKGMQFVQNTVQSEVESQVREMRANLTETIEKISSMAEELSAGAEVQLVELAIEIAKKIVIREVTIDREIALALAKVSLKRLNSRTAAQVRLSPDDFAFVQTNREKLEFHGSLEIVEDRSITPGGCLIHTDTGDIDARIESQFDEIAHGLLGN